MDFNDEEDFEYVALSIPEAFVFRIPPRSSAQGHKAADWKDQVAVVRVEFVTKGKEAAIKLIRHETDKVFAIAPIRLDGPQALEPTFDSSRYFAIRIEDGKGNHAFVGIGFNKREDAFDLKSAIAEHEKHARAEGKPIDLGLDPSIGEGVLTGFSAGQSISINIGSKANTSKPGAAQTGGPLFKLGGPGSGAAQPTRPPQAATQSSAAAPPTQTSWVTFD